MRLLAIVPCYNEESSVATVVAGIKQAVPEGDVLVVDDGSTDRTAEVARAAGATVLSLAYNMGIGAGMQAGYQFARQRGYEVAAQVDGDGQHDPAELPALLTALREKDADLVVGSRFLGPDGFKSTALRRIGITLFAWVLSLLTRRRLTDPTSGFRVASRRAIGLFADDYPEDYPEVESLYLAHLARLRLAEVPVSMRPRAAGHSSITATRSTYYLIKVMMVLLLWVFRKRPRLGS